MTACETGSSTESPLEASQSYRSHLRTAIRQAIKYLPLQAPIRAFVALNTLQNFEDQLFHQAVQQAHEMYGSEGYLPEERYRRFMAQGRIRGEDIWAVLSEELGDDSTTLIGLLGTKFNLRREMLYHSFKSGSDYELDLILAETDALVRFREDADAKLKERAIDATRQWILRDFRFNEAATRTEFQRNVQHLLQQFGAKRIEQWPAAKWEKFTLHLLWKICLFGVQSVPLSVPSPKIPVRPEDMFRQVTGIDSDLRVNQQLIQFCSVFLDQGISRWNLPNRERGFWNSFSELYRDSHPVESWLRPLPGELQRIAELNMDPLASIQDSLTQLGIPEEHQEEYLTRSLVALRGWAGMLWQMETNADWMLHPAPPGTLDEYLAVRLLLQRLSLQDAARDELGDNGELRLLQVRMRKHLPPEQPVLSSKQRAFKIFQLAQTRGWKPEELQQLTPTEWTRLVQELEAFHSLERRRIYHLAYERQYRNQTLDALAAHDLRTAPRAETPRFQFICCIDDREESIRRHLEEVAPDCETLAYAGFFAVAMYYRGVADAHYQPLCPVVVKPKHYVQEEVAYSFGMSHRRRTATRKALGKTSHWLHTNSRSVLGGIMLGFLGSLASFPLVLRVLFPRLTAQLNNLFGSIVRPPPLTRLLLERLEPEPRPEKGHFGFTLEEMSNISERVLRDMGITDRLARLVIIAGHGSSCLNNPHEASYDCGACGGGKGGPNARALAEMLNDTRVRETLAERGVTIPATTYFLGGYHNTGNDDIEFFDLHLLPSSHYADFEAARNDLDEARMRDAHERCRRFESADLSLSKEAALRHVQARTEDLSQVRPEMGHASTAVAYVGRRHRTRGLFMDRRAFLVSYDPTTDDDQGRILERVVQPVFPVCSGINLQYFFSFVDPTGFGSGSKLPHNITSLLGVMDGAASDLRTGLPWQGVEIHEPLRCLFIIETTPALMLGILQRNPALRQIVQNQWGYLVLLDPDSNRMQIMREGVFEPYDPQAKELPVVDSSLAWYRGQRQNLGYATIRDTALSDAAIAATPL